MSSYAYSRADKILLGTDFPHHISDLEKALERITQLDISDERSGRPSGKRCKTPEVIVALGSGLRDSSRAWLRRLLTFCLSLARAIVLLSYAIH